MGSAPARGKAWMPRLGMRVVVMSLPFDHLRVCPACSPYRMTVRGDIWEAIGQSRSCGHNHDASAGSVW